VPAPAPAPSAPAPPPPPPAGSAVADEGEPPPPADVTAAAEAVRQRAIQHSTEQTRTYPCTACGGELEFDIAAQRLKCPHCGVEQDIIEDAGRVVAEQDLQAALHALQTGMLSRSDQLIEGEKEIVCQNCGGHTTFVGSLTATRCPYCATPIQRDDIQDAPTRLAVDGVLPFQVDEKAAEESIQKWIHSRWFAPNAFKKYYETGSFTSIYTAYFTYDADTVSQYTGRRGDTYTTGTGDNKRTETRWRHVNGQVANLFDDMTVLANDGLDRKKVTALEPWPTELTKAYSAEYKAGHLARTYDHDVQECFGEARGRMENEIRSTVRRDIGGDKQEIHQLHTQWRGLTYKHLLLPVWLLTVIFEGRPFQVFINGVTGEVQGQRPWSKLKIAIAVVVAVIVAIILITVFNSDSSSTST